MTEQDIPNIRRARGYRLYTENGRRLVDLWQAGGCAVLGHTPRNVVRELKNIAERGLFAPYPTFAERRFIRALSALFPDGIGFRVFSDQSRMNMALEYADILKQSEDIPDPAFFSPSEMTIGTVTLWRPFCVCPSTPLLTPVLPWLLGPVVLVITEQGRAVAEKIPPSDTIAPVILAGATRAVYNLITERNTVDARRISPKIAKSLSMKGCIWKRNGIYLHTNLENEAYAHMFRVFLDANFLLPPNPCIPAVLPSELSQGEEANLSRLFAQDQHLIPSPRQL